MQYLQCQSFQNLYAVPFGQQIVGCECNPTHSMRIHKVMPHVLTHISYVLNNFLIDIDMKKYLVKAFTCQFILN